MGFKVGDIISCNCGCKLQHGKITSVKSDMFGSYYEVESYGKLSEVYESNAVLVSAKYKVGDTVWVNGSRRTIDAHDPILDLYQLNGGTWVHESSFAGLAGTSSAPSKPGHTPGPSSWAASLPGQLELEFETMAEQQSPSGGPHCECGVDKVGSGLHSTWCPKYERF